MNLIVNSVIVSALAFVAINATSARAAGTDSSEAESKKPRTITDRRDPDYVRCRSEPIIGSLARKRRVCMTNSEWVEYTRTGSEYSKEFVEDNQPGFMMTPN